MKTKPSQRVVCDACGEKIVIRMETEDLDNGKVGYFFRCGNCREKYPAFAITKKGLELQDRLADLRENIDDAKKTGRNIDYLTKEFDRVLGKYQKEVTGPYE